MEINNRITHNFVLFSHKELSTYSTYLLNMQKRSINEFDCLRLVIMGIGQIIKINLD